MKSYWEWNKENFDWHFDNKKTVEDVQYVGKFCNQAIEKTAQDFSLTLGDESAFDEVSFKGKPFDKQAADNMEGYHNDLYVAGFTENNTGGFQTRENLPEIFHKMAELSGLGNPQVMFLVQPPGRSIPWHRDSYNNYRRNFAKVSDDVEVIRYLVQLNDWNWGHYVLVGNNVLHQYSAGDIHCWREGIYHATGNVGYWPRYALTITGIVTDKSLHLQNQPVLVDV